MRNKTPHMISLFNKLHTEIVEVLNYSNIICKINPNDYELLEYWLTYDNCNKMYRLEYIKKDNYFYIENCDLQDLCYSWAEHSNKIDDVIKSYIEEGYYICDIVFEENGFILKDIE